MPVFLEWKTRLNLKRFYQQLVVIENATNHQSKLNEYLAKLDAIEAESVKLHFPAFHLTHHFELRQYIHDMRERLEGGW